MARTNNLRDMCFLRRLLIGCALSALVAGAALASVTNRPSARVIPGRILFNGATKRAWHLDQSAGPTRVVQVRDPAGSRDTVLRFRTYNGDIAPLTPTRNPRSQLVTPENVVRAGQPFWESYEVYLPTSFPVSDTDKGWLALGTPFYGAPFLGSPSTGISIVDGNFRWQANGNAPHPYQIFWQSPVRLGRWVRVTWCVDPRVDGYAELYFNGRPVPVYDYGRLWKGVDLPVLDLSDTLGPWFSDLQVYYKHDTFSRLTIYFRGFRIATTKQVAEAGAPAS